MLDLAAMGFFFGVFLFMGSGLGQKGVSGFHLCGMYHTRRKDLHDGKEIKNLSE